MHQIQPVQGTVPSPGACAQPLRGRDRECEMVLHMIAKAFKVPRKLLLHPSRCMAGAARARHTAMYLMHVVLGRHMAEVGAIFGRDRTTVSYACARVEDLRDDPAFDARLARFESRIHEMTGTGESFDVAC